MIPEMQRDVFNFLSADEIDKCMLVSRNWFARVRDDQWSFALRRIGLLEASFNGTQSGKGSGQGDGAGAGWSCARPEVSFKNLSQIQKKNLKFHCIYKVFSKNCLVSSAPSRI